MDLLKMNSMQNRDVEQMRAFLDQMIAEVAICENNKFDQQHEELVEAFGGDSTAKGFLEAYDRANKLEARLVAAKTRQDAAFNMYAATIESTNKTVAIFAKSAAKGSEDTTKAPDGKFLKRKLKEPDEWKDSSGKTHRTHQMAFAACEPMSVML